MRATKIKFSRKHDSLFLYAKDSKKYTFNTLKEKSYNRGLKPYRFKGAKKYQDETGGYTLVNMKDVWEIGTVGRTSKKRVGYPTQKPKELLKTIVTSLTNPGDTVADFLGG